MGEHFRVFAQLVPFFGIGVLPFDRRPVERTGQIPHDRVQQRLHADVVERRPAERRLQLPVQRRQPHERGGSDRPERRPSIRYVSMMASSTSDNRIEQLPPPLLGPARSSLGNLLDPDRLPLRLASSKYRAFIWIRSMIPRKAVGVGGRSGPDRNLHGHRMRRQPIDDLVERPLKVGPDPVHLVDEADPGNAVFVRLPPDRFALGLDPLRRR